MKRTCPNCKQAKIGWKYLQCEDCRKAWQLSDRSNQTLAIATYVFIFATFILGFPIKDHFQTLNEVLSIVFPLYGLMFLFGLVAAMLYLSKFATFQPREGKGSDE